MAVLVDRPLSLNETCALVGCSRRTLTKWVREGRFPAPSLRGRGKNGKQLWAPSVVAKALKGREVRPSRPKRKRT
jgi:excisionase family DNA binding protein